MGKYVAKFDRISRNHNVPDLAIAVKDGTDPEDTASLIAEAIYRYAKGKLLSRGYEVVVDLDAMKGTIYAGVQVGGSFTLVPA